MSVARVAAVLCFAGCGARAAPEEAPPLAVVASIPTAAPGAQGVVFSEPKSAGGAATAFGVPGSPPPTAPELAPTPLPLPVDPSPPPPSPFAEPPAPKLPKPPKHPGIPAGEPTSPGVQL